VPTSLAQRDTVAVSTVALDPKVASTACSEVPFQGLISSHNVNIVSGIPELTIAEREGEIRAGVVSTTRKSGVDLHLQDSL